MAPRAQFEVGQVAGLVLGWVRERSGSLAIPLFLHTAYNGCTLLLRLFN